MEPARDSDSAAVVLATAVADEPALLDLYEVFSTPSDSEGRREECTCGPSELRLRSSDGRFVRPRGRSPNRCDVCARIASVEWIEMAWLDALAGNAPTLWIVVTTSTPTVSLAAFWRSREKLTKALRRRWPDAQVLWIVEYSTGLGPRSGGERRPHWNGLVKGIPVADRDEVDAVVRKVWCSREDAEPDAQFVGEISDMGGLGRYMTIHLSKESQRPPEGFRGHRVTYTRGYWTLGVEETRRQARQAQRVKRTLWRVRREVVESIALDNPADPDGAIGFAFAEGIAADLIESRLERELELEEGVTWELVHVWVGPHGMRQVLGEVVPKHGRRSRAGGPSGLSGGRPPAGGLLRAIAGGLVDVETGELHPNPGGG